MLLTCELFGKDQCKMTACSSPEIIFFQTPHAGFWPTYKINDQIKTLTLSEVVPQR
jgi:hypothetical protein